MSTLEMYPFGDREIINMPVGADDNKSFWNQFPLVPMRGIARAPIRPGITIAFRLLLVQRGFFHGTAVWAVVPCWKTYRGDSQKTVLRICIVLPEIRGPAKLLDAEAALQPFILNDKRRRLVIPPHVQAGNH